MIYFKNGNEVLPAPQAEPLFKLMTSATIISRGERWLFRIREGFLIPIIFVGLGGFLGACTRYLINKGTAALYPHFPLGTLISNILAGLIIGFIIGIERGTAALPERTKLFLTTGLLGGLSTFSAFSMETVNMLEKSAYLTAGLNTLLNVGISLLCVFAGLALAKTVKA